MTVVIKGGRIVEPVHGIYFDHVQGQVRRERRDLATLALMQPFRYAPPRPNVLALAFGWALAAYAVIRAVRNK